MYMSTLKCMHKQTVTKQKAIIILFLSTVCISSFHLLYRNDWSHSRTYTHTHTHTEVCKHMHTEYTTCNYLKKRTEDAGQGAVEVKMMIVDTK